MGYKDFEDIHQCTVSSWGGTEVASTEAENRLGGNSRERGKGGSLLPAAQEPSQKVSLDGGSQAPPSSWIEAPGLLGLIPGRLLMVWVFRALSCCSWKSNWLSKAC